MGISSFFYFDLKNRGSNCLFDKLNKLYYNYNGGVLLLYIILLLLFFPIILYHIFKNKTNEMRLQRLSIRNGASAL